jgi:hypothetical protein
MIQLHGEHQMHVIKTIKGPMNEKKVEKEGAEKGEGILAKATAT